MKSIYKMLLLSVMFLGAFSFSQKVFATGTANVIDQQGDFSVAGNPAAEQAFRQELNPGISGTVGQVGVYMASTAFTPSVNLSIFDENISQNVASCSSSIIISTTPQFYFCDMTASGYTLLSTHQYRLASSAGSNNVTFYGSTNSSLSGCTQTNTPFTGFVSCSNSIKAISYTVNLLNGFQFVLPLQHHSSSLDSTMQVGVDFPAWTLAISDLPVTSTPLYINVNSAAGTDSLYLAASSTCSTCYENISVPKKFSFYGNSTTSPDIFYAHAFLHYASSTGPLIADDFTYFGILNSLSSQTMGNFFTPQGYQELQSASTTNATSCDRFNDYFGLGRAICDAVSWLFIPNGSELQGGLSSINSIKDTKIPFAYVAALSQQIESDDCIGVSGCVIPSSTIPSSVFIFQIASSASSTIITTPPMFSVSNMQHFFGDGGAKFRTLAVIVMWITVALTLFWTTYQLF